MNSLSGLWEKLLKFLDDEYDTNGRYYEHTEDFIDLDDYEKKCFDYLIEILNSKGKKIILFFDNFGQLFLDNLKEKEKRRLREILMQCNDIRIIGASAIVLQDLHDYSQPFYEFFQVVHLDGLSKEETYQLIERLQEGCEHKIDLKKNKGKIDTLAILTGGVIRTLMMVYEVLLDDQDGSALSDLELILDQVTPLYKHRIEDLPIQQRRIVDVIAKRWDAISAKEIATEIREDGKRMQTKLISAQLAQLEKNNVVEKKQTNTKNHLYQLKERFFNIWYLMRNGDRRDRRKVKWLTKFLEMWYDDEESIETFLERHILRLKSGGYNAKSALLLAEALADINKINPIILDNLMEATSAILNEDQRSQLNIGEKKLILAIKSYKDQDLKKAIYILEKTKEKINSHKLVLSFFYFLDKQIEKIGIELSALKNVDLEDLDFVKQLCILSKDPNLMIDVMSNSSKIEQKKKELAIGDVYFELGDYELAEKHYNKAVEFGEITPYKPLSTIYSYRGDDSYAEELLVSGLKEGVVEPSDVLEFYEFHLDKEPREKIREIVELMPKDDPYFNFYKGLDIFRSEKIKSKKFGEAKGYLEKALVDFDKIKVRDLRFTQLISNLLLFNIQIALDKIKLKEILERFEEAEIAPPFLKVHSAFGYILLGDYKRAFELMSLNQVIKDSIEFDGQRDNFNDTLLLFMAKNQHHLVFDLFSKNENLKEALKPTYYALMTLLKEEYPNEIIKMGEELTQPVSDILTKIEEMKEEYK
ncbi:tetratricopeptide repeat protein [Algoriphagus sp. Y33]|uniref:tetratricopeptide repeat protein n=1 Tax=Algoriphagus sp. Y33 TaxID=2772483 RepID=UPI001CE1C52D|nr:tetratricopeptide repeat protein [Algoriphagus sp. Y33]